MPWEEQLWVIDGGVKLIEEPSGSPGALPKPGRGCDSPSPLGDDRAAQRIAGA